MERIQELQKMIDELRYELANGHTSGYSETILRLIVERLYVLHEEQDKLIAEHQ